RIERIVQSRDGGVEAAAGDQHQRKPGTKLLVMDANRTFFVDRARSTRRALLTEHAGRSCRHDGCRGAGFQNLASGGIHVRLSLMSAAELAVPYQRADRRTDYSGW